MVKKAYKFCIYPNKEQRILIAEIIGYARFVFNHFLGKWNGIYKEIGKGLTYNSCSSRLTQLKKELDWLKEVDSIALQSSVKNMADAFSRLFKKQNKAPRFKSKNNKVQSYTTRQTNGNIAIIGNKIKLPKLGHSKFANSREVDGRIINATIRRNPSGKYVVSLLVETAIQPLKTESSVGVDFGLKDFAVLSTGEAFFNPKWLRKLERKSAIKRRCKLSEAKNYKKQKRWQISTK